MVKWDLASTEDLMKQTKSMVILAINIMTDVITTVGPHHGLFVEHS